MIEAYLLRDPQIADNFLAEIIGGVSKNTVAAVRGELEGTCHIDRFEVLRGRDGKQRPVQHKKIVANTLKEAEAALSVIGDLPENCAGKTLDVTTATRRARRNLKKQDREDQRRLVLTNSDHNICLFHCPFQMLESVAELSPNSVDLIFTDIPYDERFLDQLPDLANFAKRVLVDGGRFVSYVGQQNLDRYMAEFGRRLDWGWLAGMTWGGPAPIHHRRQAINRFNPLLIYSKGEWTNKGRWVDLHHVDGPPEKEWHDWQKPLNDVRRWLRAFSNPGDLVVDVCAGSSCSTRWIEPPGICSTTLSLSGSNPSLACSSSRWLSPQRTLRLGGCSGGCWRAWHLSRASFITPTILNTLASDLHTKAGERRCPQC